MAQVAIKNKTSRGTELSSPATELFAKRTIFLTGAIDDAVAEATIMQLLYLAGEGDEPIELVLNSPGGSVNAGFAIIDCMNAIKSPVHVLGTGIVASMAANILACGEKGHRALTPNADVLIHQPLMSGTGGQASDIAIAAESIIKKRAQVNKLLAEKCSKTEKQIEKATDRDNWMSATEAVEFGLADAIVTTWGEE